MANLNLNTTEFSAELVEGLCGQFKKLVSENWMELWSYRNGDPDSPVKAAVSFVITPNGSEYNLTSTFYFSLRFKHRTNGACTYSQK